MPLTTLPSQVLETLDLLLREEYSKDILLEDSIECFSKGNRTITPQHNLAEGTWCLLTAFRVLHPCSPRYDDRSHMPFVPEDQIMQSFSLRILAEYVTVIHRGKELPRKYDLRSSNKDRYDLVVFLLEKWQRRAKRLQEHLRQAEKRNKTVQDDKENRGVDKETSLASRILARKRGRRIRGAELATKAQIRSPQSLKPSPLGATSSNTLIDGTVEKG